MRTVGGDGGAAWLTPGEAFFMQNRSVYEMANEPG